MPSIVGPKRFQRPRKLRSMDTPINRAARPEADKPTTDGQIIGPPVDPRTMDDRMCANREAVFAWAMAGRAERAFVAFLAAKRCPLDDWMIVVELVRAWAEGLFLAVASMPEAKRIPCLPGCRAVDSSDNPCPNLRCFGHAFCPQHEAEEDDREAVWAPRTEAEARAAGLSIVRR